MTLQTFITRSNLVTCIWCGGIFIVTGFWLLLPLSLVNGYIWAIGGLGND